MGFNEDFPKGEKAEKLVRDYLMERQGAVRVFQMSLEYPEFDLVSIFPKGKIRTVEVKYDPMESKTGNIAIEYMHRGYFSGILVSSADWYVIVLKRVLLCMKKRDLFYFLRENRFEERDWQGDKSQIILVPSDELIASGICDIFDYWQKRDVEIKKPTYLHEI
jgi:hypothetical protein